MLSPTYPRKTLRAGGNHFQVVCGNDLTDGNGLEAEDIIRRDLGVDIDYSPCDLFAILAPAEWEALKASLTLGAEVTFGGDRFRILSMTAVYLHRDEMELVTLNGKRLPAAA